MDYISAYVREVGKRLPGKIQEDVERELHSLITDAIEEKHPVHDGAWLEEDQLEVLREFGSPAEMAAQYAPKRQYLVGPRLFPVFRIAAAAVVGALLLSTMVGYFASMQSLPGGGFDWLQLLTTLLEGLFASVITGLGSITLVFAILERVLPDHVRVSLDDGKWDPVMLEEEEGEEAIQPVSQILGIVFLAACLLIFNIFPEKVGYFSYLSSEGYTGWVAVPALAETFFTSYLPMINIYWIFTMLLSVVLLIVHEWNRVLYIVDFVISILGLVIVVQLMNGPKIFELGTNPILTQDVLEVYETVNGVFTVMWEIGLVFILAGAAFAAVRRLLRIFNIHTLGDLKKVAASLQ